MRGVGIGIGHPRSDVIWVYHQRRLASCSPSPSSFFLPILQPSLSMKTPTSHSQRNGQKTTPGTKRTPWVAWYTPIWPGGGGRRLEGSRGGEGGQGHSSPCWWGLLGCTGQGPIGTCFVSHEKAGKAREIHLPHVIETDKDNCS